MSLFTFFRAAPGLFESFGFVKEQPVFMSIVLFQLLQGPLDEVSYQPALAFHKGVKHMPSGMAYCLI